MELNKEKVLRALKRLGFKATDGTTDDLWRLEVRSGGSGSVSIYVNLDTGRIEYPNATAIGRDTCTLLLNASGRGQEENLVTLDCYIRLLRSGYEPSQIELEKQYKLGREYKGFPDITVLTDDDEHEGSAFMFVECKTDGAEYERELDRMRRDGGQLMSYWSADQRAAVLVLYSSNPHSKDFGAPMAAATRHSVLLTDKELFRDCRSQADLHRAWDQQFDSLEVFNQPYNRSVEALQHQQLVGIADRDAKKIYNDVLEVLRLYSVSDKQNAFMKLINLLIAKVYDETCGDRVFPIASGQSVATVTGLMFQVTDRDDDVSLQRRLLHQYTQGMRDFLDTDTFNSGIDILELDRGEALSLVQRSAEFHFTEVYDEASFQENAKIVASIVKILQRFRFKNRERDQILGDLFENLLNTAIKQEAGQYFTPMPIVDFMIDCLPLEKMVNALDEAKAKRRTPAVIDYSCGSGHFIIAALEAIHKVLEHSPSVEAQQVATTGYDWAGASVYGIEKDYRLAKTTKISTFLNGDGQANIIHADGLAPFTSERYAGLLKSKKPAENGRFDIVVANPPYAVDGFIKSVSELGGGEVYSMFEDFTLGSTEIETLFIERTGQLLREGGVAALVLPASVINTDKYGNLRQYLLNRFRMRAVVYLGTRTFSDTSTSPILLFLERYDRPLTVVEDLKMALRGGKDVTVGGLVRPISTYIKAAYGCDDYDAYAAVLNEVGATGGAAKDALLVYGALNSHFQIKVAGLTDDGAIEVLKAVQQSELDKLALFVGVKDEDVIVVTGPTENKDAERAFLGYKFSTMRSKAGIELLQDSPLYNKATRDDRSKISNIIREQLATGETTIMDEMDQTIPEVSRVPFNSLIEYAPVVVTSSLIPFGYSWAKRPLVTNAEIGESLPLGAIVEFVEAADVTGSYPTIKIRDIKDNVITKAETEPVVGKVVLIKPGDILIPRVMPSRSKVVHVQGTYVNDSNIAVLRPANDQEGKRLYDWLILEAGNEVFYDQVNLKMKGFKESYRNIKDRDLQMIRIPVTVIRGSEG